MLREEWEQKMLSQKREFESVIQSLRNEIQQLKDQLENSQGEQIRKYDDLKKEKEAMEKALQDKLRQLRLDTDHEIEQVKQIYEKQIEKLKEKAEADK